MSFYNKLFIKFKSIDINISLFKKNTFKRYIMYSLKSLLNKFFKGGLVEALKGLTARLYNRPNYKVF